MLLLLIVSAEGKKKKSSYAGNNMSGLNKQQMIFINIREDFLIKEGISKMAKDFQDLMSTGGLKVGIVGTEGTQMIAVASNLRETIEIRRFATQME